MTAILNTTLVRISTVFILLCLLLAAAYPVWAQDSTSAATKKREKIQDRIETRKENISDRLAEKREKMASREASLRTKLDGFRNKQKAQVVERINNSLKNINEKMVARFKKVLERLSSLLDKLEKRVNANSADIKDPVLAREAIADARSSISSATEVVNLQSTKDYTLELTSESRAKTEVTGARKLLHEDLKIVLQVVNDAKKSVSSAIRVAKSGPVPVGTGLKEATKSGQ